MIPVDYNTRGYGDFGAIPNAVADFCNGPENFAVPDWPDQYFTRWVLWRASDGVRYAKATPGFVPADGAGTLSGLFDGDLDYTALSGGFDQNGRLVVAVQRAAGEIELRRFQAGNPTAFTWSGFSPRVWYNGELEYEVSNTDVVCFYLPEAGDKILVRVQRDNYGIEYEMNAALNTPLDRLTKVDRVEDVRVALWGMTGGAVRSAVRQSVIISQPHQPWPELIFESAAQSVELLEGAYFLASVPAPPVSEASVQLVTLLDGEYMSTVVLDEEAESAEQNATLLDGEYELAVVSEELPGESSAQSATLLDGDYEQVIVNGPTIEEGSTQNATLLDGTYEAV